MNIDCGKPITCTDEQPDFLKIQEALTFQLNKSREMSYQIYSKLDKIKTEEPEKCETCISNVKKEPQGFVENMISIIDSFDRVNYGLQESLNKLTKLVG
jgi:hypothetical protein